MIRARRAWAAAGLAAAVAILALAVGRRAAAADPDALWKIVHGRCAPDERATGRPAPCLAVDLAAGYAVLKDRSGATQVLVIPTRRITGIESPDLVAPGAPDYLEDAWRSRIYVERLAGRPIPRDDLALAINSIDGRSQDQLHIHVDCLRPDVRDALRAELPRIGRAWAPVDVPGAGRRYLAMRLGGADLDGRNPIDLLAWGQPAARARMGLETLIVAGETFAGGAPGFVLLSDRADPLAGDFGSGEQLLDHACRALAARA